MVSGTVPQAAYASQRAILASIVSNNFYDSHIALVEDPNFYREVGDRKRPIARSSCILATRGDVARLRAVVMALRDEGVVAGAHPERSKIYYCRQQFDFMTWRASGKGFRVSATFKFVMLQAKGKWYIHHLEKVFPSVPVGKSGILSPSEQETYGAEEYPYDAEEDDDDSVGLLGDIFDEVD